MSDTTATVDTLKSYGLDDLPAYIDDPEPWVRDDYEARLYRDNAETATDPDYRDRMIAQAGVRESRALPVDEWKCVDCETPIGWVLTCGEDGHGREIDGMSWAAVGIDRAGRLYCEECTPHFNTDGRS